MMIMMICDPEDEKLISLLYICRYIYNFNMFVCVCLCMFIGFVNDHKRENWIVKMAKESYIACNSYIIVSVQAESNSRPKAWTRHILFNAFFIILYIFLFFFRLVHTVACVLYGQSWTHIFLMYGIVCAFFLMIVNTFM